MDVEYMYQLDYMNVSTLRNHDEDNSASQSHRSESPKTPQGKYNEEIKSLSLYAGVNDLNKGMTIKITLQEILKIIPKKRPRIDSYMSLVRYLHEFFDVELIITSNKTKYNGK